MSAHFLNRQLQQYHRFAYQVENLSEIACLMDISTGNSLLRIAWIAAGFSTESRKYAIKLLLQDGELTTLFTDYRELFLEQIRLNDRFSELNAKLSAPDDVLVAKLEELFASSSSKCELTAERENMIVKLESTKGKRIFRWRFEGHLIDDGHQLFFDHVVRPLLDMLSMAANLHRLEFLKESSKPVALKEAFAFPQVRKLYEVTASCLKYSKSESDVDNSSLPPTPEPVLRKRSPSASCESNSSGSMPSTPPPADTKQSDATERRMGNVAEGMDASTPAKSPEAEKNCMKVTPKKRKLRF